MDVERLRATRAAFLILAATFAAASWPQTARATDEADQQQDEAVGHTEGALGEIIVTATRRQTTLVDTPMAVSVAIGQTLARDQITSAQDLTGRFPSLLIGQESGQAVISIRGIGFAPVRPGDEGRVAYYVDDVYIARPSAQLGTFFDINRVEVLRGPQGTLYGRNATGGAIMFTTNDPTNEPSGYLNVTGGNYNLARVEGALSGPLPVSDTLSARVAFQWVNHDGYGVNFQTGNRINAEESHSIRGTLLWQPTSAFSLKFIADGHWENDSNDAVMAIGPGLMPAPAIFGPILYHSQDVRQVGDPVNIQETYGFSLPATYHISDALTASAIVGNRRTDSLLYIASTPTAYMSSRGIYEDDSWQRTADLQLNGEWQRFNFVTGVSYFYESQFPELRSALYGALFGGPDYGVQGTRSTTNLITESAALFADATFHVTDRLSITGGARYTDETKKDLGELSTFSFAPWPDPALTGPQPTISPSNAAQGYGFSDNLPALPGYPRSDEVKYKPVTKKAVLSYDVDPELHPYVSFQTGFKSGGFNYGTIQPAYLPEEIKSYEAGLKGNVFDRRLTYSLDVFRMDYTHLQTVVQQTDPTPGTFVLNTGQATIDGVEWEFSAQVTDALHIDGNGSILNARFGELNTLDPNLLVQVNIGGNRIPEAPKYTLYVGADYTWKLAGGKLVLRGDYRGTGTTYFDIFNHAPARQDPYGVEDANLTFTNGDGKWHFGAFVENIANTYAATTELLSLPVLSGMVSGSVIPPRTYGARIGYSF